MRTQLIKSLFAMVAMILGASFVSPTAFAETGFAKISQFKPMSAAELQKKSPKFRSQYMDKLANFYADYESLVNRANAGGFIIPKTENAKFLEIFAGSEAYASNTNIWSRSQELISPGSLCPIAGGIGVQGKNFCEPPDRLRCTVNGQKGVGCAPEVFGTGADGIMYCGAIIPGEGVGRDFSRTFCMEKRKALTEAQKIEYDSRDIDARAVEAGRTGQEQWLWELENYHRDSSINNSVGQLCRDNGKKLGIPAKDTYKTCNPDPNVDGLDRFDRGTVIFLHNNMCACTGVLTRYEAVPQPPPTKSDPDFMAPFACIKDAFKGQGQDVSDKYLAMIGVHVQALGYLNGDSGSSFSKPAQGKGSYQLAGLSDVRQDVMTNYTYKKKFFGNSKKANPKRGPLRTPLFCKNDREKFGQTPNQLFLRRVIENVEAKGWCSSQAYSWPQSPKSLSPADAKFLTSALRGDAMPTRASSNQKDYFKTVGQIFGVDTKDDHWKGTFRLHNGNQWGQGSLYDRRTTYKLWKAHIDGNAKANQAFSGDAKACFNETTSPAKSDEVKRDLCMAMVKSCGLSPAICDKKSKCVDVSGYKKAGDGSGSTTSGTRYNVDLYESKNTTPKTLDGRSGK